MLPVELLRVVDAHPLAAATGRRHGTKRLFAHRAWRQQLEDFGFAVATAVAGGLCLEHIAWHGIGDEVDFPIDPGDPFAAVGHSINRQLHDLLSCGAVSPRGLFYLVGQGLEPLAPDLPGPWPRPLSVRIQTKSAAFGV